MEQNYYLAEARCGHVGRNFYIIKTLPIKASDAHEASLKARYTPRVKHHDKYAIQSLTKVTLEQYQNAVLKNQNDPYFTCGSKQEQSLLCTEIDNVKIKKADYLDKDYAFNKSNRYKMAKRKLEISEKEQDCNNYDLDDLLDDELDKYDDEA